MEKDTIIFIAISAIALLIAVGVGYFFSAKRAKRYIKYADNNLVRTGDNATYEWKDLKHIHHLNKYISGGGINTANYGMEFTFAAGKATIDRRSNIYDAVAKFEQGLAATRSTVITKGVMFIKNK